MAAQVPLPDSDGEGTGNEGTDSGPSCCHRKHMVAKGQGTTAIPAVPPNGLRARPPPSPVTLAAPWPQWL
jgi:hypothetical protein